MTPSGFAQRRCRNHAERQAACRCPGCGFDFCRECVTEHDERLLCSRCVSRLSASQGGKQKLKKKLSSVGLSIAGIVAAWIFFFLAGEFAGMVVAPKEVQGWHAR